MIYEDINILSKIYICINICLVVFQIVRSVPPLNNVIKLCEAIETVLFQYSAYVKHVQTGQSSYLIKEMGIIFKYFKVIK